ncbi:MAG TPA: MFS transporter [Tetrasphaera sp.]|uniref:MFS transporter n=1 Tax=Nostocoides sp. TaxID=1917966 RepID=UPI002C9A707C|nr:MFS transporter [Tetrasphaera sp.]HNQ06193.1 MFS transporter [Tetrasphaera sp.]
MTPAPVDRSVALAARTSVFALFTLAGLAFAGWASRIADAKLELGLSAGELGATLFAMSLGSVLALPSTGKLIERFGLRAVVSTALAMAATGILVIGLGVDVAHSRALLMVGLFLAGLGVGSWDVGMNLEGSDVERHLGRAIMPHFHAAFSGGTVVSALLGAALSWAGVRILVHMVAIAVLVVVIGAWSLRSLLPHDATAAGATAAHHAGAGTKAASAWTEPRTLLIGFVVLVAAFTEGTANDWLAVAFHEGYDLPTWAGVLAFATFLTFMTVGRLVGTGLLDRHGRVPVLRVSFGLAVLGALLVIFGGAVLAYLGAAIWGLGAALGFPVGMSASADDPARAASRMSVVATIGYAAFIAGPPLLGFLGDHVGVLKSLLVVGAGAILALLMVPSVREPEPEAAPTVPSDAATGSA